MRVVLKIGTNSISNSKANSVNFLVIELLCKTISELMNRNCEVVLVTSGAVGCGVVELAEKNSKYKDKNYKPSLEEKPFLAAVGQPILIKHYTETFMHYKKQVAQILINSSHDFVNGLATTTILKTLKNKVVPIINENDSVYDKELKFGDNDTLAAHVAKNILAKKLILITDVEGLYSKKNNEYGELITHIKDFEIEKYMVFAKEAESKISTGGMITKLKAAKIAGQVGCITYIIKNTKIENIEKLIEGENFGTQIGG